MHDFRKFPLFSYRNCLSGSGLPRVSHWKPTAILLATRSSKRYCYLARHRWHDKKICAQARPEAVPEVHRRVQQARRGQCRREGVGIVRQDRERLQPTDRVIVLDPHQ